MSVGVIVACIDAVGILFMIATLEMTMTMAAQQI